MTEQSAPSRVTNPLTLVMTAKSAEDYAELQRLIREIQSLPVEKNPIIVALDHLANVHFASFVFLGNNQLGVITAYDGDFETYINEFADEIGDIFDELLKHCADSPPLPVQIYRKEFLEYCRAHDMGCEEPFYSAYPDRTVLDVLSLDKVFS
jgi:hypothetical protein